MRGALSKEIKNGSKKSLDSGLSWLFVFGEEDEVCGCRNKWRGAIMGPRGRGRAQGVGRALDPRGQVLAPLTCSQSQIFSNIPEKIILNFQGIWRTFIFEVFFIARIIQKTDIKYYFCFI